MAVVEAPFSIFSSNSMHSSKCPLHNRPLSSLKISAFSTSVLPFSLECSVYFPPRVLNKRLGFRIWSAVEETVALEENKTEKAQQIDQRKKLFVQNLPWSFTVADIKNVFGECGTVTDVEIIKQKDGKNRGYAFVTMGSGEEARAAVEKFDSFELACRIIRVEVAKRFKKPSRSNPMAESRTEAPHKLYVSNLSWKVRSNHLREFFSAKNPVSARVVFDSPSGSSAGYGFVAFATKEDAEAAIASFDGKELLGRPIRLKFSERNDGKSENNAQGTT